MEIKATLIDFVPTRNSGGSLLTFKAENVPMGEVPPLMLKDLRLKATEWREKRSLTANAYCWVLLQKLAEVLKTTKDELYELKIQEHGYLDTIDDVPISISLKSEIDIKLLGGHWKAFATSPDGKFTAYHKIKGSSEYDTKEMAHLIDMIIQDCKDQGIETLPPAEIERLKAEWKA